MALALFLGGLMPLAFFGVVYSFFLFFNFYVGLVVYNEVTDNDQKAI